MAIQQKTGKKKLCWNCEGSVDREAENCPFCGVYLHPEDADFAEEEESSPTYQAEPEEESELEENSFEAPYKEESSASKESPSKKSHQSPCIPPESGNRSEKNVKMREELVQSPSDVKTIVLPILLLMTGAFCFIFSILMHFFAKDGVFTLRWNADYWLVYLILSLPLLFLGSRTLRNVEEREI